MSEPEKPKEAPESQIEIDLKNFVMKLVSSGGKLDINAAKTMAQALTSVRNKLTKACKADVEKQIASLNDTLKQIAAMEASQK